VDPVSKRFNKDLAYQLFYGKNSATSPDEYPAGFDRFYQSAELLSVDECIETTLRYLHFVGINISAASINDFLASPGSDHKLILKKAFFILKGLAHNNQLDVSNPYKDNYGDIDHLLRIETRQSQLNIFEAPLPDLYGKLSQVPNGYGDDITIKSFFSEVEETNQSFFITGKAGTGKSTFIQYFTQSTKKTVIRMAFTGIAAINVGGVTIHSFFRFPLRPMIPGDEGIPIFNETDHRRKIIEATDTFIIDEVSMLRADVLEAIGYSLRQNGGDSTMPFGGKQILLVGDPFQLPPVTNEGNELEQYLFRELFNSSYFFDSDAYNALQPKALIMHQSHRQKEDQKFVSLLDDIRLCKATPETVASLNTRVDENFVSMQEEFSITLTTSNAIARGENDRRLTQLRTKEYSFVADVRGDFDTDQVPAADELRVKRGAQVMFTRNDSSGHRRWVNGTIGIIEFVAQDIIEVRLADGNTHKLEREIWDRRGYKLDRENGKVISDVKGRFVQYPLRLAWAITIHKSQGLTFDKVIIDLGTGAFVNGQLYTALSRCRGLNGITLRRPVRMEDIIHDIRLTTFYETLSPSSQT
jgi:hypothetical protein